MALKLLKHFKNYIRNTKIRTFKGEKIYIFTINLLIVFKTKKII